MLRQIRKSIAPPATPLQDFTYHWKQLMNFYVNHLNNCKVPIQSTNIPHHLDRLLEILLEEEKEKSEPGPCLEYLLQHKLLDLLATLATAETPPGMRIVCFTFLRKLLGRSKHPLLYHTSIYVPVQRLILLCNGNSPSPIEAEEVQFLLTLCFLVCKYPHITNIINDVPIMHKSSTTRRPSSERLETEKVTYVPARKGNNVNLLFEPLNTQAITLVNPNLLSAENDKKRSKYSNRSFVKIDDSPDSVKRSPISIRSSTEVEEHSVQSHKYPSSSSSENNLREDSTVSRLIENTEDQDTSPQSKRQEVIDEMEGHLQSLKELRLHENIDNYNDKINNEKSSPLICSKTPSKSKCLLLEALMSYVNTADNTVRIRACEGIMALTSLEDVTFAETVARSELPSVISSRLKNLFNAIPAHVDPNEIDMVDVTWGLDSPMWNKEKKFPGCRQVATFYMWYDYCNQLIREAHSNIADALAKDIRTNFFERVVTPALGDHQMILVTALVTKCLKEAAAPALLTELSYWLMGHNRHPEIPNVCTSPVLYRLVDNCYTDSDDLTVETLKLFEEIIDKRHEHALHCLVLMYLIGRGYYDNTAADSAITSWSDEEDEREREKKGALDLSYEQSHSRTLAPSNIHRIVNCFLSLVPRNLQTDPDVNSYEKCMAILEKQYSTVLRDCFLMAWPLEAVTHDDSASSDSRPEADHCSTKFDMGPFLTMLLDKVCSIPRQKYEINLQLTVVISRLTLLPHPYLHEFLLNPLIPLVPGTKSLFTCLQKIVKQLMNEVPKIPHYKELLKETRQRLLDECAQDTEKENTLLESVIVTEEFCKGLAAIAYVKYHHSM